MRIYTYIRLVFLFIFFISTGIFQCSIRMKNNHEQKLIEIYWHSDPKFISEEAYKIHENYTSFNLNAREMEYSAIPRRDREKQKWTALLTTRTALTPGANQCYHQTLDRNKVSDRAAAMVIGKTVCSLGISYKPWTDPASYSNDSIIVNPSREKKNQFE